MGVLASIRKLSGPRIFGVFVTVLGVLLVCHAAYSAVQHRVYLRIIERNSASLPLDLILQALASIIITAFGITYATSEFKIIEVTRGLENKSIETLCTVPAFYYFKHRGRAITCRYRTADN